ncbi:murein biosynthesis integral membrane protein MurJ [Phaeovulum vinaykumarii]|uniref:Probable lipid II flippase MurJ n=1 Tax=Phaeovulum vinaykumarii TaxID=407234 RepID=A0A1N7L2R4_9RHOB|nr:murein biosynthesis integral membrane protein MurJ [Phaeovulum vinaykumarii]SIS68162.1 putative peptidoglycan lipid II flippase [Phaeovulum vinaykumarii]SOC00255.1 putative peptidoglycan lipid II flippase [Phaeovulum vinaykumarii]
MAAIRLVRGFVTVGGWTLASRVLGFARDIMMAAFLGAGPVAEAFLIAFSLPNMFRRFFAEGAFNMAFVPMFSKKYEAGEDPEGFARDAFWGMATLLSLFTLLAMAAMPWLVLAMASGFAGDARFDMAVAFGKIAFPYILFISLAALISGVLNATGRFAATAAAPVLLNILFVAAMLGADALGWPMGPTLAWTVPVAGVAQLALVWAALARTGLSLRFRRPRLTPELRRLAVIAAPAVLAGGVVQINLIVGRQVASFTEGAVAWLSYADRLYQLPLGVVGIAIGVVLLPDLSRKLRAADHAGGRASFNRGTEFALMLTLPSAVALIVMAQPLVQVLFGRGAFGASDIDATAAALAVYGAGLPAFVLHKVLQPLYYAREDTRRPFHFAVVAMGVNALLAVGLMPVIGFLSAAIATTVSAWVMVAQLWHGARGMGDAARPDTRLRRRLPRLVIASAAMGAVLWLAAAQLAGPLATGGLRYGALAGLVGLGIVVYFGVGGAIGAFRLSDFRAALRR